MSEGLCKCYDNETADGTCKKGRLQGLQTCDATHKSFNAPCHLWRDEVFDEAAPISEEAWKALDSKATSIGLDPEVDPDGIKPGEPGAKLDAGKISASLLGDFSLALTAVAEVATFGANKYSRGGWQHVKDGVERYRDAEWRHKLKQRHEDLDKDSGLPHKWHHAWNVLATLELELREADTEEKGL